MKKVVSVLALAALMFSANVNAQDSKPKKKKAKTEATASAGEKKSCAEGAGKKGCCAHK